MADVACSRPLIVSEPFGQEVLGGGVSHVHGRLLEAYRGPDATQLADVADDGYIMQNAGHHLVHAQQLPALRELLMRPAWLECKLVSYGVASVVADFRWILRHQCLYLLITTLLELVIWHYRRICIGCVLVIPLNARVVFNFDRQDQFLPFCTDALIDCRDRRYLMVQPEDSIKLLLEAFQMSVSACVAHPTVAMLQEQLLGRLMLVRKDTQVSYYIPFSFL